MERAEKPVVPWEVSELAADKGSLCKVPASLGRPFARGRPRLFTERNADRRFEQHQRHRRRPAEPRTAHRSTVPGEARVGARLLYLR